MKIGVRLTGAGNALARRLAEIAANRLRNSAAATPPPVKKPETVEPPS